MTKLEGTWVYQSLRPSMAPPSPVVPWSPPGRLDVRTDGAGKVEGKLKFPAMPGLELTITGSITPPNEPMRLPEGVDLTGRVKLRDGRESVNKLRGYFIDGGATPCDRGNDLGGAERPGRGAGRHLWAVRVVPRHMMHLLRSGGVVMKGHASTAPVRG